MPARSWGSSSRRGEPGGSAGREDGVCVCLVFAHCVWNQQQVSWCRCDGDGPLALACFRVSVEDGYVKGLMKLQKNVSHVPESSLG